MTKLLAALSLPQVGKITINGEIEDSQGKGVIIQLELKDREYTLRALTIKEAQKWVKVLTQLRDGGSNNNPGGLTSQRSTIGDDEANKKSPRKKSESRTNVPASTKQMGGNREKTCCGFC